MDNKEFAKKLEKRTRRLSSKLSNSPEGRVIRTQITKCGTSVGANYREANRVRSEADFKNRIRICESEASETEYWIEVIGESKMLSRKQIKKDHEECGELLAIFTSIGAKL